MSRAASIVHLNVIDFAASIAAVRDPGLADRAFVIAGATTVAEATTVASASVGTGARDSGRALILGLSRRAREEGLEAGMGLAEARRRVPELLVVPPDAGSCAKASAEMERLASRYAPLIQNDSGGHLYLDLAGTTRLFGPHIDCAVRLRNEIVGAMGIEPTVAIARNKLVAKVATRSIRPAGIACVREGDEASFLAPQDALLLPGMGPSIARLLSVTGIREIRDLAALTDEEALSIFGRRGLALRDSALGLDDSPVAPESLDERLVRRRLEFAEDLLEAPLIRAALISLVEDAGLELRASLLAARHLRLALSYADGARCRAEERSRTPLVMDAQLIAAADRAYARAATRRVRLRAIDLELADLVPARREPDLFIPEGPTRLERLQSAVDASRSRFGPAAVTRASAITGRASAPIGPQAAALAGRAAAHA
jgi:DNA polymerase-4